MKRHFAASFISNDSTKTRCTSSSTTSDDTQSHAIHEGWSYWHRQPGCWTKVYVELHEEGLYILPRKNCSLRRSILRMIVKSVFSVPTRGNLQTLYIENNLGETIELFINDPHEATNAVTTWYNVLTAASKEMAEDATLLRASRRFTTSIIKYNEKEEKRSKKKFTHRIRNAWRKTIVKWIEKVEQN